MCIFHYVHVREGPFDFPFRKRKEKGGSLVGLSCALNREIGMNGIHTLLLLLVLAVAPSAASAAFRQASSSSWVASCLAASAFHVPAAAAAIPFAAAAFFVVVVAAAVVESQLSRKDRTQKQQQRLWPRSCPDLPAHPHWICTDAMKTTTQREGEMKEVRRFF